MVSGLYFDHDAAIHEVHNTEAVLRLDHIGLFAIFAGAGHMEDGLAGLAARLAKEQVRQYYRHLGKAVLTGAYATAWAEEAFGRSDRAIRQAQAQHRTDQMASSATLAHVYRSGLNTRLAYAHVGTGALLYMNLTTGQMTELTRAERAGGATRNALGNWTFSGVRQSQIQTIELPCRLALVTDGILGYYKDELLTLDELEDALNQENSPVEAVDRLFASSQGHSDKAAVVIDVLENGKDRFGLDID